jgi:hypothetical protein
MSAMFLCLWPSAESWAETATPEICLPESVLAQFHMSFKKVGEGNYRKLGFRIYHASLWAPDGVWNPAKPYALKLQYARSLSRETLVDSVMGDIRDQGVADDGTLARWADILSASLPDVEEDDTMTGLAIPGKKSLLFYNGKKIASIDDQAFSDAFFNIWLGNNANESLRKELFGQPE